MPKQKVQTPQEIYWARKQAQEAYLPPGLINHGNTCFMNSVLQGLIATRLLVDLVQFSDISEEAQEHSSTLLLSQRSPQLTNGHDIGGPYEKEWVDMPIGDKFVEIMRRAWRIQSGRKRESLSPKDLLAAVGRKHDQYLDFAQQDAHEFLRILLDAMRMEEQDIIKQRQPPPPKQPKKRRRSSQLSPSSTTTTHLTQSPSFPDYTHPSSQPLSEADTLISFSDMIFGGKLTSILVCQKCKHISQTYEDFNDISLSLKPEDYAVIHSRKRNRFKKFAKKLTAFPGTSLATANAANATNSDTQPGTNGSAITGNETTEESNEVETLNDGLDVTSGLNSRMGVALSIQRSSSVPPSPREREDPQISEKMLPYLVSRRRSMEHLHSDLLIPPANGELGPVSGLDQHSGPPAGDDLASSAVQILDTSSVPTNEVPDASDPEHSRVSPSETKETESDDSKVIINNITVPGLPPRVEFAPEEKPIRDHDKEKLPNGKEKKKRDDDSWTKISRRISLTVKLGLRDKDKERGRDRDKGEEKDKGREKDKEKKGKGKDKEKDKEKTKDKTAEIGKDKKRSVDRRFSGMPIKSKQSSPITSISDTLFNSSDDRLIHEVNNQSPSLAPSTTIVTSASSLGTSSSTVPDESPQSQTRPPIATPTPLRSFSSQSQNIPRLSTPLQSIQSHMQNINTHVQAQVQKVSGMQRSKSPKLPKQTKEEQEYLRKILADVAPLPVSSRTLSGSSGGVEKGKDGAGAGTGTDVEKSGGTNPLARLKTSTQLYLPGSNNRSQTQDDHSTSSSVSTGVGAWLPLAAVSQFSGLEECLRMFTAVEVLDGENMVGCRRCWKLQNGYVKGMKDGEDSDDEDDEEKEPESVAKVEAKEKLLAPPLKSLNSQSSQSSAATFASAESSGPDIEMINKTDTPLNSGIIASPTQSPIPVSMSTPVLAPPSTTSTSDTIVAMDTPPLPHRSNSTPVVEQVDHWPDVKTPKAPSVYPAPPAIPPKDRLHGHHISAVASPISPQLSGSTSNTPGGLPIPRISTTPATETVPNGSTSGAGVEDVFTDGNHDGDVGFDKDDEAGNKSGTRTPASTSSQSSATYDFSAEDSTTGTDNETRKVWRRQGMVFRDSLVVPARMPGRPRPKRTQTMSTERDGSDVEGADTPVSLSGSATPTEESDSGEESAEESASDIGEAQSAGPLVPPGLGHQGSSSLPSSLTTPSRDAATEKVPAVSPVQVSTPKAPAKVKKKKERILRPAFKRYLISIPPPVLVIHLKRFQQLNPSSSSPLSSFAERLASGFSVSQNSNSSGSRGGTHGGGLSGFGGIGGGGFKKLEEFVSFPEWLDLGPFLEPKKEEDTVSFKWNKPRKRNGTRDKDGRCMYRLYAVVVHIGNMLGGHYVSYVALPDEPPVVDARVYETNGADAGEKVNHRSIEKGGSDESTNLNEKRPSSAGKKTVKRQWAYVSDTNVRLVSLDEVLNARAYICMYERV